jgi:hypothetical protein
MAVVAPPPFKSNLDHWGSSDSAIYPSVSPAPMTDIMSYQYPPPPSQNGADMDIPPSGYLPNYSVSSQTSSGMDIRSGPDSGIPSRDRSDSLSKSLKLKRSISTPSVGAPLSQPPPPQHPPTPQQSTTPGQDPLGLAAEKRRNKLGYHRTSVACGKFFLHLECSQQFSSCDVGVVLKPHAKATAAAERSGASHRKTTSKGVA